MPLLLAETCLSLTKISRKNHSIAIGMKDDKENEVS